MAGGFRSFLVFWAGGAAAPAGTLGGYRSPLALWMGGASAPTGGPSPPSSAGVFTVSGGWVSLTFPEFFSDVCYTDAPVTKRTN